MKTAVITGASSGLGREFVRQFYSVFPEIERVWLIARRTDRLQELAEQLEEKGISTLTLPLDLCDTMSFTAYQEHLVEEQPEIALLVNNAGCGYLGNIGEIDTVSQTRMIDLNLRALTAITNLSVPYMDKGSRILNVSSIASFCPTPRMTVYSATKAYVSAYTIGAAEELKAKGITVTAVCPGPMAPWPQSFWQWVMWWIPGPLSCCPTAIRYRWPAVHCGRPERDRPSTPPDCSISSTVCWQNSPRPN